MVSISRKPFIEQTDLPRSGTDLPCSTPRETLPTMYDLPSENPEEPGLPDEFHDLQPQLLSRTLRLTGYTNNNFFTASDLNLYYDVNHPLWYKRPDWFLAIDVPRLYDGNDLRRSYVIWQEGRSPEVAIEFLSPGTEADDLGRFYNNSSKRDDSEQDDTLESTSYESSDSPEAESAKEKPPIKLEVYEHYLRVPHYIVYSRFTQQLRYFKLAGGQYQEQPMQPDLPSIWLDGLEIGLGVWQGVFENVPSYWLRWCDRQGNWLLTDTEQAEQQSEQERLAKEQERLAKEQAQAQLLQAARNLLATGMELEQVSRLLGLSADQVRSLY